MGQHGHYNVVSPILGQRITGHLEMWLVDNLVFFMRNAGKVIDAQGNFMRI